MNPYLRIETPLRDAKCLATVLSEIANGLLSDNPEPETGDRNLHRLTEQDVDNVFFLIARLNDQIELARKEFYRAHDDFRKGGAL